MQAAFDAQGAACAALGSAFMAMLMPMVPGLLTPGLRQQVHDWPGDIGPTAAGVPLRLAGALHALHLSGYDAALSAAYPPNRTDPQHLATVVTNAFKRHEGFVQDFIQNPPQTNEVRRAAALISAAHWLTERTGCMLKLSEIGASAGLNLLFEFFHLNLGPGYGLPQSGVSLSPIWTGPLPPLAPPYVHDAQGCDLNPLDVSDPKVALRLKSYLWPDQPERLKRTQAAINLAPTPPVKMDALAWLPGRLANPQPRFCHMIYSTIAWQYLPPEPRATGEAMIRSAGKAATKDTPLAWFRMEADGRGPGAALTLDLWPGGHRLDAGRADFHGRWIDWRLT